MAIFKNKRKPRLLPRFFFIPLRAIPHRILDHIEYWLHPGTWKE